MCIPLQLAANSGNERAILGAERFILLAALVAMLRFLYATGQDVTLKGWTQVGGAQRETVITALPVVFVR